MISTKFIGYQRQPTNIQSLPISTMIWCPKSKRKSPNMVILTVLSMTGISTLSRIWSSRSKALTLSSSFLWPKRINNWSEISRTPKKSIKFNPLQMKWPLKKATNGKRKKLTHNATKRIFKNCSRKPKIRLANFALNKASVLDKIWMISLMLMMKTFNLHKKWSLTKLLTSSNQMYLAPCQMLRATNRQTLCQWQSTMNLILTKNRPFQPLSKTYSSLSLIEYLFKKVFWRGTGSLL